MRSTEFSGIAFIAAMQSPSITLSSGSAFILIGPTLSIKSEEHTSEVQSLMRISYAVFCLTKKKPKIHRRTVAFDVHQKHILMLMQYTRGTENHQRINYNNS